MSKLGRPSKPERELAMTLNKFGITLPHRSYAEIVKRVKTALEPSHKGRGGDHRSKGKRQLAGFNDGQPTSI